MEIKAKSRFFSTRDVAQFLQMKVGTLNHAVWEGRVAEPSRGPGNTFYWSIEDIERASRVLRHRGLDTSEKAAMAAV